MRMSFRVLSVSTKVGKGSNNNDAIAAANKVTCLNGISRRAEAYCEVILAREKLFSPQLAGGLRVCSKTHYSFARIRAQRPAYYAPICTRMVSDKIIRTIHIIMLYNIIT